MVGRAMADRSTFCAPVLDEWCAHQCGRIDLVANGPCCSIRGQSPPACLKSCPMRTKRVGWPAERSLLREKLQCRAAVDPPLNDTVTSGDAAKFQRLFLCSSDDEPARVSAGERAAKRHRISFAFIVRDGGEFLDRNLFALANLGGSFADWRLFYLENDSTDDTRRLLTSFGRRFPGRVSGESLDGYSLSPSAFLCAPRTNAMNCLERTALLAALRQRLLGLVLGAPSWPAPGGRGEGRGETHSIGSEPYDVLLMLDIDFVSFSMPNYLRAFASAARNRAAGFFASSVYKDRWGVLQPYDSSAVVPRRDENSTATCERWQNNNLGRVRCLILASCSPPPPSPPPPLPASGGSVPAGAARCFERSVRARLACNRLGLLAAVLSANLSSHARVPACPSVRSAGYESERNGARAQTGNSPASARSWGGQRSHTA